MRLAALAAVIFLLGDSLIAGQPILIEGCGGNCGLFAILTALGEEPGGSLTAVEVSSRVTAAILVDTLAVEDLAETKEKLTAPFNSIKKKEDLDRARKILNHALDINPSDRQAFMIAADIFEPGQFFDEAAVYLSDLSDLIQAGGDLFARLGHPFFGSRNFTAAEINLNRARELSSTWKLIPKELGQIAAAKEDYGSALRFYEESLNSDPQDAETYFLRAEAAEFSGNWTLAADSLEHGLALQPDRSAYRTKLVQLYAEHQESEKAALNIQPLLENPPPDAKVLAMYAAFLEEIGQFDNALTLWKGAVELDPGMENAYYGMAHILLDQGHFSECLRATEEGLAHSPSSARLYLTKAAAQEKLGLWYGARRTLQQGSLAVEDLTLLEHRAGVEEQYGQNAGQAYQKLVLACEKIKADKKDCSRWADRGILISLRDGNTGLAEWFADRLKSAGRDGNARLLERKVSQSSKVCIPGGMAAILQLIGRNPEASQDRFLEHFSTTLLSLADTEREKRVLYERISGYFKNIMALKDFGKPNGDTLEISLSNADSSGLKKTRQVFRLLGWEEKENGAIEPLQKADAHNRQMTSAALGFNEMEVQKAFQAGETFILAIKDDWVPVALGEKIWNDSFFRGRIFPGGFAEALAKDSDLAKLYAGISRLDESTSKTLIEEFGMKALHDKWADRLYRYSADLILRDGRALVPGGPKAEPVWQKMVGADPAMSQQFFKKLLDKDDGKMLAFFSSLMELDSQRQKYFTSSSYLTKRFYDLLESSPEMGPKPQRNTPFRDFISQIPLDAEGHIRFPGSARIWMVAKGQSQTEIQTSELQEKALLITNPNPDDAILLRLAQTEYSVGYEGLTELANLLGVAGIEAHGHSSLDESSALLLAQEYAYHREIWPYLSELTGLDFKDYSSLFRLKAKLQNINEVELNDVLGEFHAVAKMLCLLQRYGKIRASQAASLFGSFCEQFWRANSEGDYAAASLNAIRDMIQSTDDSSTDPDDAVCHLLTGIEDSVFLDIDGNRIEIRIGQERRDRYQRVMELQKVPSLRHLFGLQTAAGNLAEGKGVLLDEAKDLEDHLAELNVIDVSKYSGMREKAKESLLRFKVEKLRDPAQELRKEASKSKPDQKKLTSLARKFLDALNPQIRAALTGIIYAYYCNPEDLLISEDESFLRRHQFIPLDSPAKSPTIYPSADLVPDTQSGSYLMGGFGDFGYISGKVTMATFRKAEEFSKPYAAAVLGSIRDTDWQALKDEDLRLVGLRVRVAREWIIRSAVDPVLRDGLKESVEGLLSAGRRTELLTAIDRFEWDSVQDILSVADLYFLGEQFPLKFRDGFDDSPTIKVLREFTNRNEFSRLQWLGPELYHIMGCSHPHLRRLSPFEYYEKYLFPEKIAERSNEFKLDLAELLDRMGISSQVMESVAEPAAIRVFSRMNMTGPKDWRTVVRAYAGMDEKLIKTVLNEP